MLAEKEEVVEKEEEGAGGCLLDGSEPQLSPWQALWSEGFIVICNYVVLSVRPTALCSLH